MKRKAKVTGKSAPQSAVIKAKAGKVPAPTGASRNDSPESSRPRVIPSAPKLLVGPKHAPANVVSPRTDAANTSSPPAGATHANTLAAQSVERGTSRVRDAAGPKAEAEEVAVTTSLTIAVSALYAALVTAAPKKDNREPLRGLYLRQFDSDVRLVSCDGLTLFVQRLDVDAEELEKCNWIKDGLILPRETIERASKVINAGHVRISFGKGHFAFELYDDLDATRLRSRAIDLRYPDFIPILESASQSLMQGERLPGEATSFNPENIAQAAKIAATLNTKAMATFPGDGKNPGVITFPNVPGAMLIIQPLSKFEPSRALHAETAAVLGANGLKRSIAALKAHATRRDKEAKGAKSESVRKLHQEEAQRLRKRIAELQAATVKVLPAPKPPTAEASPSKTETLVSAAPSSTPANIH
jgi:hypothetical protein